MKQWIDGSLVNWICETKSVSKQHIPFMITCSNKTVLSPETMLSTLANFPCIHWVDQGTVMPFSFVSWCLWCVRIFYWHSLFLSEVICMGGSKGGTRDARPCLSGSKFFQFHVVFRKICQNRMFPPSTRRVGAPPRGNPVSATDLLDKMFLCQEKKEWKSNLKGMVLFLPNNDEKKKRARRTDSFHWDLDSNPHYNQ